MCPLAGDRLCLLKWLRRLSWEQDSQCVGWLLGAGLDWVALRASISDLRVETTILISSSLSVFISLSGILKKG